MSLTFKPFHAPRFTRVAASTAAAAAMLGPAPDSAAVTYDTRAFTGDAAPGTAPGVNYSGFRTPVLNGVGQTAFWGSLTGVGVDATNDSGIWSEGSGTLGLVARSGDAAPGTVPGVNYNGFFGPVLNAAGQTAFFGFLAGAGVDATNNGGIWSEGSGTLGLVARSGDTAPGTAPGVSYSDLGSPVLNAAGQTAFFGFLAGAGVNGSNNRGIWSEGSGTLGLVARTGDAAPGTGPGVNYSDFNTPVLNGAGQTAFIGLLTGVGVDATNNGGIWSEGSGTLGLVARSGDAAPGTAPGVSYSGLGTPVLNGTGQTAFIGSLTGTGVGGTNDGGIWSEGSGTLGLVAREGDAAPGTAPGVNYSGFSTPVLNGAGQTAFRGSLTGVGVGGTNDGGIWSEGSGTLGLVAREGDAAPGTAPGVNYSGFSTPVLNGAGQTAFRGFLAGAGVNGNNNTGIWATDPDGVLTLIVREGELFDVSDDPFNPDFRTVASFNVFENTGNEDGRPSPFNDAGQLAFFASFTDGTSGIFVATIPEPASLTLLGAALLALGPRRRSR